MLWNIQFCTNSHFNVYITLICLSPGGKYSFIPRNQNQYCDYLAQDEVIPLSAMVLGYFNGLSFCKYFQYILTYM